ncbi:Hypothetical predicted protein, partial [Pelobates cultripes]
VLALFGVSCCKVLPAKTRRRSATAAILASAYDVSEREASACRVIAARAAKMAALAE